jgi:hypothetical protein
MVDDSRALFVKRNEGTHIFGLSRLTSEGLIWMDKYVIPVREGGRREEELEHYVLAVGVELDLEVRVVELLEVNDVRPRQELVRRVLL